MFRTLSLFLVASVAVACGGSDLLGGDPVGRWRILPNLANPNEPDPIEERHILEFLADGTFIEIDGPDDEEFGTWTQDGGDLILQNDDSTQSFTLPFRATATRFVFGALVPVGSNNGGVGTWTATVDDTSTEARGDTLVTTIEIRGDMTATLDYDRETGEDETYEGTWINVGDDYRITLMPEENFTLNLHASFVDGVMGTPYERI